MSNDNNTSGLGIGPMTTPGNGRLEGGTTRYEVDMALPGGKEAIVSLRIGAQAPDAEQQRHELLANVCPQSLTEGLERDLSKLQAQFEDYTGFDKQGARQMRVTGRERELLEMKIANRRNALQIARAQRALAKRKPFKRGAPQISESRRLQRRRRSRLLKRPRLRAGQSRSRPVPGWVTSDVPSRHPRSTGPDRPGCPVQRPRAAVGHYLSRASPQRRRL